MGSHKKRQCPIEDPIPMTQKKIKVLRIIARLNVGGPAIHTILLTQALNNERFESLLVTGQVDNTEKDMIYLAREKKVSPLVIPELGRQISLLKDLIAFWKVYRIIRREKPDIVHTHTAKAGALGRAAAILAGVPVRIHTFHGHIFESYFNRFYIGLFLFIERVLAYFSKYIIVVSQAQKREIRGRYKISGSGKIKVVPLGLELEKFSSIRSRSGKLRKGLGISDDMIAIGIIGRLVSVKNHRMFLEAAKHLLSILGDRFKIKYLIVGDGEERAALKAYTKELNLSEDVFFCGWRENMADVYSDLDIVVLTSLNEGTPVALIEALAAGKPVVATDVGGVGDVVEDGVNGYCVVSEDVPAFARRIADLVEDPDKRAAFGARGREMVREKFSKKRLVEDITRLYEEALLQKTAK